MRVHAVMSRVRPHNCWSVPEKIYRFTTSPTPLVQRDKWRFCAEFKCSFSPDYLMCFYSEHCDRLFGGRPLQVKLTRIWNVNKIMEEKRHAFFENLQNFIWLNGISLTRKDQTTEARRQRRTLGQRGAWIKTLWDLQTLRSRVYTDQTLQMYVASNHIKSTVCFLSTQTFSGDWMIPWSG